MSNTTTAADRSLTIRRTFDAPRERVFAAFTDAATIKRWMQPPGSTCTGVTFDPRVGGTYRIAFDTERAGAMTAKGTITALHAPDHLAYTWVWEEDDASEEHETYVRIDFIAHGDTTEMLFVHDGFVSEESTQNHARGWNGGFDHIPEVL